MPIFESSIFGIDSGGFAWENVFHVQTPFAGTTPTLFGLAEALNDYLDTTLTAAFQGVMTNQAEILGYRSRAIYPVPYFTATKPTPEMGTRGGTPYPGGVCGRLVMFPTGAALHVSSMFINNGVEGDFVNDTISSAYTTALESLGDQFMLIDGTDMTYHWQLVQYHKKTHLTDSLDEYYVSPNPTTLNKRMRA